MNSNISLIVVSILKTLGVSTILSITGWYFLDLKLIECYIVTTLLQFVIFYMWNSYVSYQTNINIERQETIRLQSYDIQGVDASCAYCNKLNFVPVRFNESNTFECTECGKMNSVYVDITVARSGEDMSKRDISLSKFNNISQDTDNESQ